MPVETLLNTGVRVVNIGLKGFVHDLEQQNATVIHVDWSPPAKGDAKLRDLLAKLGS